MAVILNIGLRIDSTGEYIPASVAIAMAHHRGIHCNRFRVAQSTTEPTLILEAADASWTAIHGLAVDLQQDCIAAVWNNDIGTGLLCGPKAADWGGFNADYFIDL